MGISPRSTAGVVEERANVVGETILCASWQQPQLEHGFSRQGDGDSRGLLDVAEGRSCAVCTASEYVSVRQCVARTQGGHVYRPLQA